MYDMLGNYSYGQTNATTFALIFEIPDNCFYEVTQISGTYNVAIKLNPGETDPSKTFMRCSEDLTVAGTKLVSCFEQFLKTDTVIKKPKIGIDF